MNDNCEIRDEGGWLTVVNRNPARRNALSEGFMRGLKAAMAQAAAEPRLAAVIITGAEGFFCSGGDLGFLAVAPSMPEEGRRAEIERVHDLVRAVRGCPRPVIAAVEGGAAGAGASLAFACDMIVAARDARFTAAYVSAGLVPDAGLTASLTAALPPQLAAEMCLTAAPVSAERLHALGAVNALAEQGGALAAAEALAGRLADGPATAQAAIKRLLTAAQDRLYEAQLAAEAEAMAAALGAPEAAEGIAAFLGKRAPDFRRLRQG